MMTSLKCLVSQFTLKVMLLIDRKKTFKQQKQVQIFVSNIILNHWGSFLLYLWTLWEIAFR